MQYEKYDLIDNGNVANVFWKRDRVLSTTAKRSYQRDIRVHGSQNSPWNS